MINIEHEDDRARRQRQLRRVHRAISDGLWYTLAEIADITGDPESSISARLRDLRKEKFGAHTIEKRRTLMVPGLWEYRLEDPPGTGEQVRPNEKESK